MLVNESCNTETYFVFAKYSYITTDRQKYAVVYKQVSVYS